MNNSPSPYIGITDFMTQEQVKNMLAVFLAHRSPDSKRKLHVGVMMSYKTLNGIPTKWTNAFPKNEDIHKIFLDDPNIFNVLHYADYDGIDVLNNLVQATNFGIGMIDALQLDMVWPDPTFVKEYRELWPQVQIIIQGNTKALELVDNDIDRFVVRLKEYEHSIDYVLLDKSMGKGLGMDAVGLAPLAQVIQDELPHLGLAAAGGLGPDTMHLVQPLVELFPGISIDAQGQLRSAGRTALDPIEWDRAEKYLIESLKILK